MRNIANVGFVLLLAAGSSVVLAKSPGVFLHAGPQSVEGDAVSVQWRYGFRFAMPIEAIKHVVFSCRGIPGTDVAVPGDALSLDADGRAWVAAAPLPLSETATPWLFLPKPTRATCVAEVITADGKTLREKSTVKFDAQTKFVLRMQIEEAFEFNQRRKQAAR